MDEMRAQILSTEDGKEKYDAVLKQLLSNRQFLARIIKAYVSELSSYSLEDIMEKYLDAESVMVSKMYVQQNLTNLVESTGTESKTNNEGNVTFDIMLKVRYPGKNNVYIGMYINVEIQNRYHVSYPIESRGVFYAARRLCTQLTKIDKDTNYGQLCKAYSIWICMGDDVPKRDAGTVALYHLKKDDIIGAPEVAEEAYDLLSVVVVRIRDDTELTDETLQILQTACSMLLRKEEKIGRLQKLGLAVDHTMEREVAEMSTLADSIFLETEKKGEKKGERKGAVGATYQLLRTGVITLPNALQATNLTEEEFFSTVKEYALDRK